MSKFLKTLFGFVFFSYAFISISYSEIVKKINISGNNRVSSETVKIFGDIEVNKKYDSEDISIIIKKLFDTRFFSDIQIELVDGNLNINLEENPIINLIIFKGVKAEKHQKAIIEMLELREKTPYVKNSVKKDIDQIENVYRHWGYYFVKIETEIQELNKNRVNLIYTIDRGEKAKIAKIFFLGDKKIRESRLRSIVTSEESRFWKFLAKNVYLNSERIELDKRLLENYYKNRGYYEVDISSSNVEYIEDKGFVLTFSIDAGKRYRFGKISANIAEELSKTEFFGLDEEFKKIIGDYYSRFKLSKILEKIDSLTELKELQFINHNVVETLDGDKVIVQINIEEGRKAFIERINIVGNNVTNESVIRGELIVDEGDPFSTVLVNKSINRLKARNIFNQVTHKVFPGSKKDNSIIEIEIEEKPTGEVAAGAGIGTEGTSFSFFIKENNWLGRGIATRASLDLSEESIRGGVNVTNPNYNYTGNSVSAGINSVKTDRLATSGYESTKTDFSLGTRFEQYQNIFISPSISASYEDVSTDSSASTALKKMAGTYTNFDFGYGLTTDRRNQPYQPSEGYRTHFYQKIPLYSNSPALLNLLQFSKYKSLGEDVIGSFKFYGKTIHSLKTGEDVRISERIFLPASRIRGFQRGKIGPKDGDDHIGGNYAFAFTVEAALPNLLPEDTKTDISIFWDNANVWGVDYDNTTAESNTLRSSIGVSASVLTAIGPLSLTIAQPILTADSDKTETFNFKLGTSF